jgi:hypothetical protein
MTPAKPQQMTGQKDDPDDLIAELTKLMATDSRSNAPAQPETPPAAPVVRIPGQPTIRIPGGDAPAPIGGKFDFGQPTRPALSPAPQATPASSWQSRLGSKPDPDPLAAFDLPASDRPSSAPSSWRPAVPPETPAPASGPAFDFDFGFNRERPSPAKPLQPAAPSRPATAAPAPSPVPAAPPPRAESTPVAPRAESTPLAPARDPIAELIAAELGSETRATPAPAPAAPAPQPASQMPPAPSASVAAPRPAPRPAPESDRFTTAPVFGLTGEPAPAPKPQRDPMDEIESLIGEAVRVELNMPQPVARAPEPAVVRTPPPAPQQPVAQQPVVPPLGSQFAPRRTTSLRDSEAGASGADEAILAAAAATGAEVGRIDSTYADERPARTRQKPQRTRDRLGREDRAPSAFRQLVVPAIAGTILVAGGFGLYWALGMGHDGGKAPVLTADATPAKTIPPKPADTAPHSVVMDELGGTAPATPKETLVSRDQTAGTTATQVAATTPPPAAAAAAAPATDDSGPGGLANRKVRTVTVRPDGTIVSSDDSVAGAAQLPVSRPNVPAVPGVSVANASDDLAPPGAAGNAAATATTTAAPVPAVASVSSSDASDANAGAAPAAPGSTATSVDQATAHDANAPVPLPPPSRLQMAELSAGQADTSASRPTSAVNALVKSSNAQPVDLIGNLASQPDDAAPARPAPRAPQVATAASSSNVMAGAGGHVQLSSQTSQAAAEASANTLQRRYGSLFNGAKLVVVRADLGAKGTYYRVMLPTSTAQAAVQACMAIKANGGDCVANR